MNNFIRLILAILVTSAYALADENVKPTKPEDNEVEVEEVVEAKENDEAEVEEVVESQDDDGLVNIPLSASDIANALAWALGFGIVQDATGSDDMAPTPTPGPVPTP